MDSNISMLMNEIVSQEINQLKNEYSVFLRAASLKLQEETNNLEERLMVSLQRLWRMSENLAEPDRSFNPRLSILSRVSEGGSFNNSYCNSTRNSFVHNESSKRNSFVNSAANSIPDDVLEEPDTDPSGTSGGVKRYYSQEGWSKVDSMLRDRDSDSEQISAKTLREPSAAVLDDDGDDEAKIQDLDSWRKQRSASTSRGNSTNDNNHMNTDAPTLTKDRRKSFKKRRKKSRLSALSAAGGLELYQASEREAEKERRTSDRSSRDSMSELAAYMHPFGVDTDHESDKEKGNVRPGVRAGFTGLEKFRWAVQQVLEERRKKTFSGLISTLLEQKRTGVTYESIMTAMTGGDTDTDRDRHSGVMSKYDMKRPDMAERRARRSRSLNRKWSNQRPSKIVQFARKMRRHSPSSDSHTKRISDATSLSCQSEAMDERLPSYTTGNSDRVGTSERAGGYWSRRTSRRSSWGEQVTPHTERLVDIRPEGVGDAPRGSGQSMAVSREDSTGSSFGEPLWIERVLDDFDVWLHGWVMDENNLVRQCWDSVLFIFLVYCAFSIPYSLAFLDPTRLPWWMPLADWVTDAGFYLDVAVNFFTAYRDSEGVTHWNLEAIGKNYLRSWLVVDCCSAFTWYRVAELLTDADWVPFLKITRLFALLKLQVRLSNMERHLNNPGLLKLFRLGFVVAVLVHWCTCLTHSAAKVSTDPDRWFGILDYVEQDTPMQYFSIMYWVSSTMLGDRSVPQDVGSVLLTVTVFWFGLMMYFTIFSSLITVMVNMNLPAIEYNNAKDKRIAFMRQLQVPMGLRLKIMDYFQELYTVTKGVDAQLLMQELPKHLQKELAVFLNKPLLENLMAIHTFNLPFLVALVVRLKVAVCLEGDMLVIEGDLGNEMYFIISGSLDIFKEGVGKVGTLKEGDFFGEGILIEDLGRRNATVKAMKACQLYSLDKESFAEIRYAYPEDAVVFLEANKRRRESTSIVTLESSNQSRLDRHKRKG